MKKGKSITLLTIISVLMTAIIVMTFINFPVGMKNYNGVLGAIETDYDISGGTAYTLTLSEDNVETLTDENIDEVISILKERMETLGYDVYSVKALKDANATHAEYDIRIEAKAKTNDYGEPNLSILNSDIAVVASYGELKFYGGTEANPTTQILTDVEVIKDAYSEKLTQSGTTYYQTTIKFTKDAYNELMDLIADNTYYLEIRLGDEVLYSGSNSITKSDFTDRSMGLAMSSSSTDGDTLAQLEAQSKQLALKVKLAGLKFIFDVSDGVSVSSPYGDNTDIACIIAISALLLVSAIILIAMFKGYGAVSVLSIVLFMLAYLWLLVAVPGVVISVGGIIGMALAIILTVDGLVITGKRITEEFSNNKTIKASFNTGFKRALMPVITTTVCSAVVAVLLLIFGKGILVSMAITLGIGTVLSIITTLGFARMFSALILPLAKNNQKFLRAIKEEE